MRCNIFKPISGGDDRMGTFLMFSQYTEDITNEQAQKSCYRVIPSKFVALNLNFDNFFKNTTKNTSTQIVYDTDINKYSMCIGDPNVVPPGEKIVAGSNNIIPQIFQSYYENGMTFMRNNINNPDAYNNTARNLNMEELPETWDVDDTVIGTTGFATQMLWRTLEDWDLIHEVSENDPNNGTPSDDKYAYYDEVKYVGDINIHSNHTVGAYSYDEIFCHIPANLDEYYYRINDEEIANLLFDEYESGSGLTKELEDWTDVTYPNNIPTKNRALSYHEPNNNYLYRYGGSTLRLDCDMQGSEPIARHTSDEVNIEYKFNTIIIFYDVIYSEPGEDPRYIHKGRPMGIYFSGPTNLGEDGIDEHDTVVELKNTFIKYVSNNDAFGQGSSFGLRLMMRYTPTPNMSTYTMEVSSSGNDYETIAQAMGGIADAIADINRSYREHRDLSQAYKNHLAQFRNNRANVPYTRLVNGQYYWFVNGRNTGAPVYQDGPSGQIYEIVEDFTQLQAIINPTTNKIYLVGPIADSEPDRYEEYIWNDVLGWTRIGITSYEAIDNWTEYQP